MGALPDLKPLEYAAKLSEQWKPLQKHRNLRRLREETLTLLGALRAVADLTANAEEEKPRSGEHERTTEESAALLLRSRVWIEDIQRTEPRVIQEATRHFPDLHLRLLEAYVAAYKKFVALVTLQFNEGAFAEPSSDDAQEPGPLLAEQEGSPTELATSGGSPYPDEYVVLVGSHVLVHTPQQREALVRYADALREVGVKAQLIPPRSKSRPSRPAVVRGRAHSVSPRSRG